MSTPGDLFQPAHPAPEPGICRSCGAAIVWVVTTSRARMPCDDKIRTLVTDEGVIVRGRESHFATCPNANEHRGPHTRALKRATRERHNG